MIYIVIAYLRKKKLQDWSHATQVVLVLAIARYVALQVSSGSTRVHLE
jgi:hypothetical protein